MDPEAYVESRNGGFYVAGTGISLDSIVDSLKAGDPREVILRDFPSLSKEQIDGAIAYYRAHREAFEAHMSQEEQSIERAVGRFAEGQRVVYDPRKKPKTKKPKKSG